MRRMILAVAVALAFGVVVGHAAAQPSGSYVGAPDLIGPAAFVDWHTAVDLTTRTVTVRGVIQNRSNIALTNIRVGLGDEDIAEVASVPATLAPGEYGTFTASLYTGTNLTVRGYVMADAVPATAFLPRVTRDD
jgi:hypothetical protein